jgi:broad specificity phosphatase PhoE
VGRIYLVQHGEKDRDIGDPGLTECGRVQAAQVAERLSQVGLARVLSSPFRRARETAQIVARAAGIVAGRDLTVAVDVRLRERMNWEPGRAVEEFMAQWQRSTDDRDYVPDCGDSSRQAGDRLLGFVNEWSAQPLTVAAVTHGGVTVDLLRTLLGDEALPHRLARDGVPPCAVTVLDGQTVIDIASVTHLRAGPECG